MDKTLREYLTIADNIHEYLDKYFICLSNKIIEEKIIELQSNIKTIQSVAYQLANVSNIATRELIKRSKPITKPINPYPTDEDIGILRSLNPSEHKEIIKGINVPIKKVKSITDIPISSLYYVENIKQYAINIEGIIIKGNIGNIVDYQVENSVKCEYGADCKSILRNIKCSYYHDPEDYIKHNLEVPDTIKNFTVGSWVYSKSHKPKTYFARHVGSRDRLIQDLRTLKLVQYREEISNRESQLIHDLLIYLILNSKGLLERYKPWKKMPVNI